MTYWLGPLLETFVFLPMSVPNSKGSPCGTKSRSSCREFDAQWLSWFEVDVIWICFALFE
jgi:hypothetical protein